ncbi:hypothetical protein F2Q70_00004056 [Brassica cretica]|uniref:Uncharacterized protein n=1 Tax=Brassica cretica TaxID=69181 RepID=A0A8S9IN33_BRACR|nr:hypothetical protein F2Q70_00004056 [Brassica cretica]
MMKRHNGHQADNRRAITGITNGTPSAILNAELLSTTTTVPLSAAKGPNFLLMDPPVLNKAISTPSKLSAVSSSTACSPPSKADPSQDLLFTPLTETPEIGRHLACLSAAADRFEAGGFTEFQSFRLGTKRRFDIGSTSATPPPPPVHDRDPWPREWEEDPIPLFAHFDHPRNAVKSTECINREIRDAWDDYDSMFYNEWLKVSIEPTQASVRASLPSAAGPSRQRRDDSKETTDETTDED